MGSGGGFAGEQLEIGNPGAFMDLTGLTKKFGKWPVFLLGTLVIWCLYTLSNQMTYSPSRVLSPGVVDGYIPFISWSIWIYLPYYFLVIMAWNMEDDVKEQSRIFWGILLINLICNSLFFLHPTSVSRIQLTESCDWVAFSCELFRIVHFFDTPANCLPSLHVAISSYIVMTWWNKTGFSRYIFLFWAVLICFSTLTTRQHLFSDVITGFAVSGNVWIYLYYIKPGWKLASELYVEIRSRSRSI